VALNKREFLVGSSAIGLAGLTGVQSGLAQELPRGPIRIVTPYPPGAGADAMVRRLAHVIAESTGRVLIIDNIGSAGGIMGMQNVAKAASDGRTLIFALTAQWAVNPSLFGNIPYDPQKSFTPISLLATAPYLLMVHPSLGVRDLAGFIDLVKKNPGKFDYASAGNGSGAHLAMEMLKAQAGINITHIPYRGASLAFTDLVTGRVPVMFATFVSMAGRIQSGSLYALAMTSLNRSEQLPDVPAIAETFSGFSADVWYMIAAPAGTPQAIIDRYGEEFRKAVADPSVREQFKIDAIKKIGTNSADAASFLAVELEKWTKVVRAANIRPE
jgi:tripartite-type tricarboxylate transporter receptor subunit TctC